MAIGELDGIILFIVLNTLSADCTVNIFDCLLKDFDKTYAGRYHSTRSGIKCQRWDSQYPHTHGVDSGFPDTNITAAANYCRNPDPGTKRWQWCYTLDPAKKWDYCNIPYCTAGSECRLTPQATEYRGTTSRVAETGVECLPWKDKYWLNYAAGGFNFNEETMDDVRNYCRNFGATQTRIWCHTFNGTWGYCKEPPLCELTYTCAHMTMVSNAVVISPTGDNGPYAFGTQVVYKCITGYEFTSRYSGVMCLMNGTWTESPVCSRVKCPTLHVPQAHVIKTRPEDSFESIAKYRCYEGFKHSSGDLVLKCLSDKSWNGTKPVCTQINCGYPPTIAGAILQSTTSTLLGGAAFYKCPGEKSLHHKYCDADGQWHGRVRCTPVSEGIPFYQTVAFVCGLTIALLIIFCVILTFACELRNSRRRKMQQPKRPKHTSRTIHPTYYDR